MGRIVCGWEGAAVCGSGVGVLTNLATGLANVDGDDFAHTDGIWGVQKERGTNVGFLGTLQTVAEGAPLRGCTRLKRLVFQKEVWCGRGCGRGCGCGRGRT